MQTGTLTDIATRPLIKQRTWQLTVWILAFTIATALSANVRIPLPFTPVPVTLQTFFVLLSGLVLGPGAAAASMGLYLALGAAGLPVWTATAGVSGIAHLSGVTAGYLLAFPAAAYLAGMLSGYRAGRKRAYIAVFTAGILILVAGTVWMALLTGTGLWQASLLGFWPFLAGDIVKTAAAVEIGLRIGRRGLPESP
jgi:biotin transport system substrate-specific component